MKLQITILIAFSIISSISAEAQSTDPCGVSSPPQNVAFTPTGTQSAQVTWDSLPGSVGYRVVFSYPEANLSATKKLAGTSTMISGLIPGATYTAAVKAKCLDASLSPNSINDTLNQPLVAFTCGDSLLDYRDNQIYPTVQIGGQCWLAKNLLYVSGGPGYDEGIGIYSPDSTGSFYSWPNAMQVDTSYNRIHLNASGQYRGVCPYGWHIPTDAEWDSLETFVGDDSYALQPDGSSGLNVELIGYRNSLNNYINSGNGTILLSSNEAPGAVNFRSRVLLNNTGVIDKDFIIKWCGVSVRCLLDD
jgi:uncharacterized protein (TIGR02145 family)